MLNFLLTHTPLFYFTQSLWRDEAFSILAAEQPLPKLLEKLTFETPLYYILLHFWIRIFGESEIAARSLSLVGFSLATVIIIIWAEKLFHKHWLSWFLPIFFFFNPMLLYYAFEVRTYGWYIFFATLSFYTYQEKKWNWYIVASILGFYTHTYFLLVPFTQAIHYVVTHRHILSLRHIHATLKDSMVRSLVFIGLLVSPWLLRILGDAGKLKTSWYFPVDIQLVYSVLGNMFVGYEGTPGQLWTYTAYLSLTLICFFVIALWPKEHREKTLYFLLAIVIPLTIVVGISFIKPLFVNRYLIPVTIAEIILVTIALRAIRQPLLQKALAAGLFLFVLGINTWYPQPRAKLPIRTTIMQINALRSPHDVVLADSPLIFFETIYYSTDRKRVFLYNPNHSAFPWYVGDSIVSSSQMVDDLPPYPIRAFIVHDNGTFDLAYHASSPIAQNEMKIPPSKK